MHSLTTIPLTGWSKLPCIATEVLPDESSHLPGTESSNVGASRVSAPVQLFSSYMTPLFSSLSAHLHYSIMTSHRWCIYFIAVHSTSKNIQTLSDNTLQIYFDIINQFNWFLSNLSTKGSFSNFNKNFIYAYTKQDPSNSLHHNPPQSHPF